MNGTSSPARFPNESAEYRRARDQLLAAEIDLRARVEAVAELRRALPDGGACEDYVFSEATPGRSGNVTLSALFEPGKDSLLVYSYMFAPDWDTPCPMCTCFLDGMDRYATHLSQRVNLAVTASAPPDRLRAWYEKRGWQNLRLLSSRGNTYSRDYHGETPGGDPLPMMNVFTRRNGEIRHFWASEMFFAPSEWHPRHVDMLWPVWHYYDLTPEGRGEWFPELSY